jgi:eukaryotic-like serine/threonine-protein kinase
VIFVRRADLDGEDLLLKNSISPRPVSRDGYASWGLEEGSPIAEGRTAITPIGGGNLYEVYLVWDETMHAICVAKLIRPDRVGDESALADVREESSVLDRLSHPVIVRRFDLVTEGPHPHLMLEHLEGPSLRRLIKRGGPLPLQQLVPLALSLAGAIHYMEQVGVVHLDVKPDNIIMGVPPRLIDLSVARSAQRAARLRRPVGTDAYMAPEQCDPARFEHGVGAPADVWGLGATLHHAVSGGRPFPRAREARESDNPLERFPQLHAAPEPLPGHLPPELTEMVGAMLDPDPGERPRAAEVAASLEPLVAGLPRKMSLSRRGRAW